MERSYEQFQRKSKEEAHLYIRSSETNVKGHSMLFYGRKANGPWTEENAFVCRQELLALFSLICDLGVLE